MPPAHPVLESPLLRRRRLRERSRTTEWPSQSLVVDAEDANVAGTAGCPGAGHPLGHLDLDREVGGFGTGETGNSDARDILDHFGFLEGAWVGAAGGWVDHRGEGTGAVLVDLFESCISFLLDCVHGDRVKKKG